MRVKIFIVICIFWFSSVTPTMANALTPQILASETAELGSKKMNFLENLEYRLFEKETRDTWDYLLLAIFIVALLIVMVFQNTRYYVITKKEDMFPNRLLEDNNLSLVDQIIVQEKVIDENRKTESHKPRKQKKNSMKKNV